MSRVSALALDDQLLAVLRDAEGFPLSTEQVAKAVGAAYRYDDRGLATYRRLAALARAGRVTRQQPQGYRAVYWTLT